jgi:hypothetical protein
MATCDQIRAQLIELFQKEDALTKMVTADQGDLKELQSESTHVNQALLLAAQNKLSTDEAELKLTVDQISTLRNALETQGCLIMQPQQILDIQFTNPSDVTDVDALYAQHVAFGKQDPTPVVGGHFPSVDAKQEWKQVLPSDLNNTDAHDMDYEGSNLVGAVGWALNPEFSGADVPFDHPFGFDWEFLMALDQPPDNPKQYTFLLTPADQSFSEDGVPEAVQQADGFTDAHGKPIIPLGPDGLPSLLGVEIDGGLVSQQFTDWRQGGVDRGDRVAVFGRWIVDCGHQVSITDASGKDLHPGLTAFRTEIHPPQLMAAARVTKGTLATPPTLRTFELTRVLFTSRPYLVSQRFTTDRSKIYDDNNSDDGPFIPHMINEVVKVHENVGGIPIGSWQLEAHPKIKSYPFQGSYEFRLIVRPPALAQGPLGTVALHGPLAVAYQFTVRSGCDVEVKSNGPDAIEVVITLNQDGYTPPELPPRNDSDPWTRERLGKLNPDASTGFLGADFFTGALHLLTGDLIGDVAATEILDQGIVTDEYDTSSLIAVNILDANHAVSTFTDNIPGEGIPAQLASLMEDRKGLASTINHDIDELKTAIFGTLRDKAQAKLIADERKLQQIDAQIAALNNIERGVRRNDIQPYPIYGWLEVGYTQPLTHP